MNNKAIRIFSVATLLSCMLVKASDNANYNYTLTESETRENLKSHLKKKFCEEGWIWDTYDDNQSEQDSKLLYKIVTKKCLENASNFKRVPIITRVKKWNKDRTLSDSELKVEDGLRELIYKRIKEIGPDFLCEKIRIANNIIKNYRFGREKQFVGDKLTEKIRRQINSIRSEQIQIARDAQNRNKPKIKKYHTTQDCPVCYEKFGDIGKRLYIAPCGHNICPDCYDKWKKECRDENLQFTCPLCRAKITGYEKQNVQPSYNPAYGR